MALLGDRASRRPRPLVVSTRVEDADGAVVTGLREADIELWQVPVTRIRAIESPMGREEATSAGGVAGYDWVVFTSRHAVDITWQREDVRSSWAVAGTPRPRLAAVGSTTARHLEALGLDVAAVPREASGASLAQALLAAPHRASESGSPATRVLWPCARDARPEMVVHLRAAGVRVDPWVVYESHAVVPDELDAFKGKLRARELDAVSFCAPSAVAALEQVLEGSLTLLLETRIVSIGPTTTAALTRAGLRPVAQAAAATGEALVLAIVQCVASARHETSR